MIDRMALPPLKSVVVKLGARRQLVFEEELLKPDSLLPHQLLAETLYSAISVGTEVAAYRGDPPLRPGAVYPRLVGYCNVAEVVKIGAAVEACHVGERIYTHQSHRSAFICDADEILATVPDGMDSVDAAMTYLFQLGYNALLKGGFTPGHCVAVIGLGVLGLAAIATTNAFGGVVHAFSGHQAARVVAQDLGARGVFDKQDPGAAEAMRARSHGEGADLVITTSNSWDDWRLAMDLCRKDGAICVLGFPGRTHPIPDFNPLEARFFYDKQLRVIACGGSPVQDMRFTLKYNCRFLMECIRLGKLPARRLVTAVEPYQKLSEIYERLANRAESPLTFVLKWK